MTPARFLFVLRLLVSAVLLYAGFHKALAPTAEFAAQIEQYKLLPSAMLTPLAFALPWMELWIGTFLAAGLFTRAAAGAAGGMFAMFIGALSLAYVRGVDLKDCGCFGAGSFPPHVTVIMDVVLLGICVVLVWKYRGAAAAYTLDKKLD